MQNSNFKHWIKIPILLILTVLFFGLLTSCTFQSGSNTSNGNSNSSNTNTRVDQPTQNNSINYDNIKRSLASKIKENCGGDDNKPKTLCDDLLYIQLIWESDQYNDVNNFDNADAQTDFKDKCLQGIYGELINQSEEPKSGKSGTDAKVTKLGEILNNKSCKVSESVWMKIVINLKNLLKKNDGKKSMVTVGEWTPEKIENLQQENEQLKKSGIGEILIQSLILLLLLSVIGLIVYQILNQKKLSNLPDTLDDVRQRIGIPGTGKSLINIVSDEGQNIQNQIKGLSEIISSSNLNVKEQIDELNKRNLEEAQRSEEARRSEDEQNRSKKITIPIDNSYTQSNEQQSSNNESEYEALKDFVSDIHNRFIDKPELTKHTYSGTLKDITSGSETATYYRITTEDGLGMRNFAIPVATRINSSSQATHLYDFYTIRESTTSALNGKLNIEEPAEIKWNQKINGWQLFKKGEIKIVS